MRCANCGLEFQKKIESDQESCVPCKNLIDGPPQIHVSPISSEDLELVLAWRSHPDIYKYFREQTGPLAWSEHMSWYNSRDTRRHDFLLHFEGRRVGVVGIDEENKVTVYIGDFSARNNGIATAAIRWLKSRFPSRRPLLAEVHEENKPSRTLFQTCGFQEDTRSDGWIKYVYRS